MDGTAKKLPVMESFLTLQGEGSWTGHAAWFIRLAGCDVGCTWCDVKDSWEVSENQWQELKKIVEEAGSSGAKIVVITGGEPGMYDLQELCLSLRNRGLRVHIETSGAYELRGRFDWICLSPKKFKPALPSAYKIADELKFIVSNDHDFTWVLEQATLHASDSPELYLQPEWSKKDAMAPKIVEFIKSHPGWALSMQTHKYLGIP